MLEQGKVAYGVPPNHDNVEFAKRALVKARAAQRRSFFDGGPNPFALQLPNVPRVSLPRVRMPRLLPKSHTAVAFIILLIAALYSGSDGPIKHVTSILGSAAKVTEAASLVVDSGADLTTTTLRSMVSITTGTLNLAEAAWHGIDLTSLDAKQVRGRVTADTEAVLAQWLTSEAGANATGAPEAVRAQWAQHLWQVAVQMPYQRFAEEHLNVSACFTRHEAAFMLMKSGYVLLDFSILTITFAPQWSNPLWEVFATPMDTQHDQISDTVHAFARTLPELNVTYISLDNDAAAPTRFSQVLQRYVRQSYLALLQLSAYFLGDLRGIGCLGLAVAILYFCKNHAQGAAQIEKFKRWSAECLNGQLQRIGWSLVHE